MAKKKKPASSEAAPDVGSAAQGAPQAGMGNAFAQEQLRAGASASGSGVDGPLAAAFGEQTSEAAGPEVGEADTMAAGDTTGDLDIVAFTHMDSGSRTTVGVAEEVTFHCASADTTWSASGGTAGKTKRKKGNADMFSWTAPSAKGSVTITVTKQDGSKGTLSISVIEPTGIRASRKGSLPVTGVGAGMELDFVFEPTTVSFAAVEWQEVPSNATNIKGKYFSKHKPLDHDSDHGAGRWLSINGQNRANAAGDEAKFDYTFTPYEAGSFDWVIPTQWRVKGGPANSLVTTTQHHEIRDSTGAAFVSKHGVTSPDRKP